MDVVVAVRDAGYCRVASGPFADLLHDLEGRSYPVEPPRHLSQELELHTDRVVVMEKATYSTVSLSLATEL